jgi:hypothetical protein
VNIRSVSVLLAGLLALAAACIDAAEEGRHLFILSGQSNMQRHRPEEAFIPAVSDALGIDRVIVVQDAQNGQPILRWWKNWKSPEGEKPESTGDLYDRLMAKVVPAIEGQVLESVTFIWMHGERDAGMKWGGVYDASLRGLYDQLSEDLGRTDIHFVIGRLSDFDLKNERYPHWTMIRKIQVDIAESNPRFEWIDTDDLNDGIDRRGRAIDNDIHYSADGYKNLGERFAAAALDLITQQSR